MYSYSQSSLTTPTDERNRIRTENREENRAPQNCSQPVKTTLRSRSRTIRSSPVDIKNKHMEPPTPPHKLIEINSSRRLNDDIQAAIELF